MRVRRLFIRHCREGGTEYVRVEPGEKSSRLPSVGREEVVVLARYAGDDALEAQPTQGYHPLPGDQNHGQANSVVA